MTNDKEPERRETLHHSILLLHKTVEEDIDIILNGIDLQEIDTLADPIRMER